MIIIRLAGLFFAFVQITLLLRLIMPFVEVPSSLDDFVPPLMDITALWLAPVEAVLGEFQVSGLAEDLAAAGEGAVSGPEAFEPLVPIAMVFWAVAAMFVLFVLRLIFRPVG